jgi:hypothetical protein
MAAGSTGVDMIGTLLNEALSLRENRRIKAALHMARLPIIQALDGYDFSFQPRSTATGSWRSLA